MLGFSVLKDFCDHADVEYNYVYALARLQQNQIVIITAFNLKEF